ncbi:hypothetical protein [Actinokineospora enzanensis]|uniref:hypothetical protein n=1 Tax=Actinokineospora enzanensis TaxID=155975 RepID=UPI000381EAFC|nr:hypothetical protein [Actinokineospora enzanensis]
MTDAELLTALADLLDRVDPVPHRVLAAAIAAGSLLAIDRRDRRDRGRWRPVAALHDVRRTWQGDAGGELDELKVGA